MSGCWNYPLSLEIPTKYSKYGISLVAGLFKIQAFEKLANELLKVHWNVRIILLK